jgi:GT2 family glycosyltransferase
VDTGGRDEPTTATRVSVIVPATDAPQTLLDCFDAIIASEEAPEEIVVIDSPGGANAATARNLGAERAVGDILLFLDADVEISPDAVRRVREAFDEDQSLSAIFGSYDDAPAARGITSRFRNLLHHHVHHAAAGPATTFWTGLGAVRREAFQRVGDFDERISYMEDVDLGMRMTIADEPIRLDPRIQGKHLKRWTVWGMVRTDVLGRGVPWTRLLLRHKTSSHALNLGWRHRIGALASLGLLVSLALLQPLLIAASLLLLVAMNWQFYALLVRRTGPVDTLVSIPLHVLHYLASLVSLPIGFAYHVRDGLRERRGMKRQAHEPTPTDSEAAPSTL